MKKLSHIFFAVLLIAANIVTAVPTNTFASANDFHFKEFIGDYYLRKQKDNSSEMEVVETMTAVFPDYNQNHGIERYIPFLNQDDTNLTTESAENLIISVTRNGEYEPHTVVAYNDHFLVRIGSADKYVHGENTYVLRYKFVHTITEFNESSYYTSPYQELYWDSNGTGWSQSFESATVNLHMDKYIRGSVLGGREFSAHPSYKNKSYISKTNTTKDGLAAWCYVGSRGSSNQSRCNITDISDGISFKSDRLSPRENMTFVVNFKDGTFVVPKNDFIIKEIVNKVRSDYYISKADDGKVLLKAKENITVSFPTKNSISVFNRNIPLVNKSGYVFTTDRQDAMDVKVTMDGKEPNRLTVYPEDDGKFSVMISDDYRYLHGEHTFTFEYELKNLINDEGDYQKVLYTPFQYIHDEVNDYKITVHLDKGLKDDLYKASYQDTDKTYAAVCNDGNKLVTRRKCAVEETADGFVFSATNLPYNKDFGFELNFKNGTFVIPEPNRNYLCWHIFIAVTIFAIAFITFITIRTIKRASGKIKYLKSLPIVPQYTPHKDYTVGELAKNYLGTTGKSKVATLLELIVAKKLSIRKEKKNKFSNKYRWFITVNSTDNLSKEQKTLIKVINNGKEYSVGQEIEIKHHSYSSSLETAFNNYDKFIKQSLKDKGLTEEYVRIKKSKNKSSAVTAVVKTIIFSYLFLVILFALFGFIRGVASNYVIKTNFTSYSIYEGAFLIPATLAILLVTFLYWPIISGKTQKYQTRTMKGIEMSRYMDGLKLYIKMAEEDRIKFLQSVEGADTSENGIVKLYEKLLPYAALFGLEKSWMKELDRYYQIESVKAPEWHDIGLNYATFTAMSTAIHSATSRPIDSSSYGGSSSGGWSSSSSSGGGGGGFSGGGGGGGGGGGW